MDFVIEQALQGALGEDVLTWDTEDSRHKIKGRDDIANLQRMYYRPLRPYTSILALRLPSIVLCPSPCNEHALMTTTQKAQDPTATHS